MFSPRDQVILDFSQLNAGDTLSGQLCPRCKGGNGHEYSLSVGRTEDGWLWWRCHRASCNFRGSDQSNGPKPRGEGYKREVGKLDYSSTQLKPEQVNDLCERLNLTPNLIATAKWRWTPDYEGRVIMPILAPNGSVRGEQLRSYDPTARSKGMIQRLSEADELMCWYVFQRYPSILVIVEDQPSALRIAGVKGMAGLALLGTSLSYERALEIKSLGIKSEVLCLDNDATSKAVATVVEYRRLLPRIKMVALQKDVKNMTQEEFDMFLQEVRSVAQST